MIGRVGLNSFTAQLRFDVNGLYGSVKNPASIVIYSRPTEGVGNFVALPTSYDSLTNEVYAVVSEFSEFVLGSNQDALTTALRPQELVTAFSLAQNYPNPFNPSTTIRYGLPHRSIVSLVVYNILGQKVSSLVQEAQDAGYHEVRFDGNNLASGVYFYRLQAGSFVQTRKLLLLR
jgi:hypothetical protein